MPSRDIERNILEEKREPVITIIITALNEESNISHAINSTLKTFENLDIKGEVVFVNDGSTDKTGDIIKESFGDCEYVRTITHDIPHGIGASFWEGVDIARSRIVAWLPGDNQTDPWETMRYINLLEHVDIVIPFIYNTEVRSLSRRMLSVIYRFIINTTFSTNFNYTNGSILYRKTVLSQLPHKSSSFFFQTDILIRSTKKGCLFAEVPFKLEARDHGASKAISFPSLVKVIKGYFRLVINNYYRRGHEENWEFTKDTQTAKRRSL